MTASGAGARGFAAQLTKLSSAQIAHDEVAMGLVHRQEMDMHLVGAELGATLTHPRQVEGRCVATAAIDVQNLALAFLTAAHEQINRAGQRRAFDQAVDGVNVAPSGGTAPKVQTRRQILLNAQSDGLGSRRPVPDRGNAENTCGHRFGSILRPRAASRW